MLNFKTKYCITAINNYKCNTIQNTRVARSGGDIFLLLLNTKNIIVLFKYNFIDYSKTGLVELPHLYESIEDIYLCLLRG